jgi:hypothetical protein
MFEGIYSKGRSPMDLSRKITRIAAFVFTATIVSLLPTRVQAQVINPLRNPFVNPFFNPFPYPIVPIPVPVNPNSFGNSGGGVTRATSSLANPINFYQYGQATGVGPIRGTVRIYNQFGLVGEDQNQNGLNGLNNLFGFGNNNQQLPGQGNTQGDDSPQGVLLHVNYAQMFLPNQQQVGGGGVAGLRGGFGAFGGSFGYGGGGFGKGYFGNGGSGL